MAASTPRTPYYPGVRERIGKFLRAANSSATVPETSNQCVVSSFAAHSDSELKQTEVFGPALSVTELPGNRSQAEAFLKSAIAYANDSLYGTLGANILIHPKTLAQIGQARFDEIITELRYGCIAINAWTGLGFLSAPTTWGAFPGHPLTDVQSGIGFVHNTMLFEKPQRTVVRAPFKPFPRNLASFSFTLLPRPPWFITNRSAGVLGRLLTAFQYRPSLLKLPRIFLNALLG